LNFVSAVPLIFDLPLFLYIVIYSSKAPLICYNGIDNASIGFHYSESKAESTDVHLAVSTVFALPCTTALPYFCSALKNDVT
jgi:hypothetical protein